MVTEHPDPRDRSMNGIRFEAALEELKRLPPLLQRVVLVRSQIWKREEVAEVMGIHPDQVEPSPARGGDPACGGQRASPRA